MLNLTITRNNYANRAVSLNLQEADYDDLQTARQLIDREILTRELEAIELFANENGENPPAALTTA